MLDDRAQPREAPVVEVQVAAAEVAPAHALDHGLAEAVPGVRLTCVIEVKTGGLLFRLVESRLRRDLDTKLGETLEAFRGAMTL